MYTSRPRQSGEGRSATSARMALKKGFIADFEKNEAYMAKHPGEHIDLMVHVSTFAIIRGVIYMTYYANTAQRRRIRRIRRRASRSARRTTRRT